MFEGLQTKEGQDQFKADMAAETARILEEICKDKEANGGLSKTERSKPRPWQYQNSNFGMGI